MPLLYGNEINDHAKERTQWVKYVADLRCLIADGLAAEGMQRLKEIAGLEVIDKGAIDRTALKELIPTIDILIVRSRTQVDADLLDCARQLKLAIRAGIGLDNIDVGAATNRGVVVMNAPTGNIVTTAEHALALLFAATRHVAQADASIRQGKWEKKKFQGNELRGKTLGIVGLGNIGKAVAERALGLKMRVVGYDPYLSEEAAAKHGVVKMGLDQLLGESDYVTLHLPLMESTRHLINRDAFSKMKKGAYLINCARGGIVDEAALIEALDQKKLTGAALDVFETEPLPANHALLARQDIVLTPHLGASTDEAQVQVGLEVAEQVSQYVRDGALKNAINVPNISLEQMDLLRPYLTLSERMGSFAAQVGRVDAVTRIHIRYESVPKASDREILTLSLLKGFLSSLLSTSVNFVNAKKILKERGIRVEESFEEACSDYSSLIELCVEGQNNRKFSCCGTLFGRQEPRIVRIDQFAIDATPAGSMLFSRNIDTPGVVGALGTSLGSEGINIARMHLGRDKEKGEAIALISIDSPLVPATLDRLRDINGMTQVTQIKL